MCVCAPQSEYLLDKAHEFAICNMVCHHTISCGGVSYAIIQYYLSMQSFSHRFIHHCESGLSHVYMSSVLLLHDADAQNEPIAFVFLKHFAAAATAQ